jgi:large subunit ribosomal protein L10
LPTKKKAETVDELVAMLRNSKITILTDSRGLTVGEMTQLRRRLREAGIEFHVAKNTLTRLAAAEIGKEAISPALEGPTALAIGYKDEVEPAKVLIDYIRTSRSALKLKAAMIDSRLFEAGTIEDLAKMPPREVLLANVVGQIQAPIYGLVNVLDGTLRGFLTVLQARAQQMESA